MKEALLFDLDGVIANSEPIHFLSHKYALSKSDIKLSLEDYSKFGVSRNSRLFYKDIARLQKKEIDIELTRKIKKKKFLSLTKRIRLVKGSKSFLKKIKDKFKIGLVTSAPFEYAMSILARSEIDGYFDIVISGQETKENKPSPDPYLLAASTLKVLPKNCIVFEDSKNGVLSATRAGMFCVGIKTVHGRFQDLSSSNLVISKFSEIDIDSLKDK